MKLTTHSCLQLFLLILLINRPVVNAQTAKKPALKSSQYAGTYSYGSKDEDGATGSVRLYPETDSTLLFNIDVFRGAPSYNLGSHYGRIKIKNRQGVYYYKYEGDKKGCNWQFTFDKNTLTVKTLNECDECGFGANVIADHLYKKENGKVEDFFYSGEGEKIYFKTTKPEEYLK